MNDIEGYGHVELIKEELPGGDQIATGLAWSPFGYRVLIDPNEGGNPQILQYTPEGDYFTSQSLDFEENCPSSVGPGIEPSHAGGLWGDASRTAVVCNRNPIGIPSFNHASTILPVSGGGSTTAKPMFVGMLLHDVECDPITFATEGKTVMWAVARGGRTIRAYDYPATGCGFGGDFPAAALEWAGFEPASPDWTSSEGALTYDTVNRTEGTRSLAIQTTGRMQLTSPVFATSDWAVVGSALAFDLRVPANSPRSTPGHMKVTLSSPSAGLHNVHLGTVQFKGLATGAWTPVSVPLRAAVQAAFRANHGDVQIGLDVHAKTTGILVDRMRMFVEVRYRER